MSWNRGWDGSSGRGIPRTHWKLEGPLSPPKGARTRPALAELRVRLICLFHRQVKDREETPTKQVPTSEGRSTLCQAAGTVTQASGGSLVPALRGSQVESPGRRAGRQKPGLPQRSLRSLGHIRKDYGRNRVRPIRTQGPGVPSAPYPGPPGPPRTSPSRCTLITTYSGHNHFLVLFPFPSRLPTPTMVPAHMLADQAATPHSCSLSLRSPPPPHPLQSLGLASLTRSPCSAPRPLRAPSDPWGRRRPTVETPRIVLLWVLPLGKRAQLLNLPDEVSSMLTQICSQEHPLPSPLLPPSLPTLSPHAGTLFWGLQAGTLFSQTHVFSWKPSLPHAHHDTQDAERMFPHWPSFPGGGRRVPSRLSGEITAEHRPPSMSNWWSAGHEFDMPVVILYT